MNQLEKIKYGNKLFTDVRSIIAETFKPVVEAIPTDKREERELSEGRHLAACDFLASVASLFAAYKSLLTPVPDTGAMIRALSDLTYGFETNQFYMTFRGYLHPILMNSINAWMDSVEYSSMLGVTDTQSVRNLMFASQHAWLEIYPASAFCFGGNGFAREVGAGLKQRVLNVF